MDPDFHFDTLTIFQGLPFDKVEYVDSEISHSNRMMFVEKTLVHLLLRLFQATACHIGLAYSLNFLKTMLLAQLIKAKVNVIKPFA